MLENEGGGAAADAAGIVPTGSGRHRAAPARIVPAGTVTAAGLFPAAPQPTPTISGGAANSDSGAVELCEDEEGKESTSASATSRSFRK